MKKSMFLLVAMLSMDALAFAGGDIAPVEPTMVMPAAEPTQVVVDDSGFYLGLAYNFSNMKYDYDILENVPLRRIIGYGEVDYNAIMAQAGYKFNKYISLESRYWRSFGHKNWDYSESYYDVGNGNYLGGDSGSMADNDELKVWGIYVKPMYPVMDKIDIYALLGYGNIVLSYNGITWRDENGLQCGGGASYKLTNNLSVFIDYAHLLNKHSLTTYGQQNGEENGDVTVYTVNAGLTYRF